MKVFNKWLLAPTLILLLFLGLSPASAFNNEIKVFIQNNILQLVNPPIIQEGRTLVPMRAFFEALGASVTWESETQTAVGSRDETTVRIPINSTRPTVNGRTVAIDVPAQIIQSRTYIPLRFVGEALGDNVVWDGATKTISITKKDGVPKPAPSLNDLVVHFIDVGQGDAILVQAPSGATMLVDGGPRTAGQKIVSYLKQAGVSSIDIVVATHPHEDHLGGLLDVLNNFTVKRVFDPGYPHTTLTYQKFLEAIDTKNIGFTIAQRGNKINLSPELDITILHPGSTMASINNNSIVLKIKYGKVDYLLTGDAETEAENVMLENSRQLLPSQILKVGHHGSRTSTDIAFLRAVNPEVAVIMVGAGNSYGHPYSETLQKISNAGVDIYRTDIHGDIVITSNGQSYSINNSPYPYKPTPSAPSEPITGAFVGSIKSDKYHYASCRYAKSINTENKIWFKAVQDAKSKGYVPCGVCNPPN